MELLSSLAFNFNLRRYRLESEPPAPSTPPGRAVQVDPIKPTLKPTGTKRLKFNFDELLSTSAFKFNLRRYISVAAAPPSPPPPPLPQSPPAEN